MGLLDRFRKKKTVNPFGEPIPGKEGELHIKKADYSTTNEILTLGFHFPPHAMNCYEVEMEKDDFSGEKLFRTTRIQGLPKVWLYSKYGSLFMLGTTYEKGRHFFAFSTYQKEIKMRQGDKVSLMFEDNSIFGFELPQKGERVDKDSEGVIIEVKVEIERSHLESLATASFIRWKYLNVKDDKPYVGVLNNEAQEKIQTMAQMHLLTFDTALGLIDKAEGQEKD